MAADMDEHGAGYGPGKTIDAKGKLRRAEVCLQEYYQPIPTMKGGDSEFQRGALAGHRCKGRMKAATLTWMPRGELMPSTLTRSSSAC